MIQTLPLSKEVGECDEESWRVCRKYIRKFYRRVKISMPNSMVKNQN